MAARGVRVNEVVAVCSSADSLDALAAPFPTRACLHIARHALQGCTSSTESFRLSPRSIGFPQTIALAHICLGSCSCDSDASCMKVYLVELCGAGVSHSHYYACSRSSIAVIIIAIDIVVLRGVAVLISTPPACPPASLPAAAKRRQNL